VALLGVLALGGIVVRNTLILADQIDTDMARPVHAAGHHRDHGAPRATRDPDRARRRAGFSSAHADVVLGPMATVLIGGTLVGTVLTLLFLPALYAAWFRVPNAEAGNKGGRMPDADQMKRTPTAWPQAAE
jgi:multidrug efflux pump